MNIVRLMKLCQHLNTVPNKAFDMNDWACNKDRGYYIDTEDLLEAQKNDYKCGMTACLGGHSAIVFPNLLKINRSYLFTKDSQLSGSGAFGKVMDICADHACVLTDAGAKHRTPKQAIKAITDHIINYPKCKWGGDCGIGV